MVKSLVEPAASTQPRWAGPRRTVRDNKGSSVKQYEHFEVAMRR